MFKLYHWQVDSAMYDRKEHVNSAVVGGKKTSLKVERRWTKRQILGGQLSPLL